MIDPATGRSRGFGFVCFLPGEEGAAAVTLSLEKYEEHRLRGKWIEVKSAAPPHKLAKNGSQEEELISKSSSSRKQEEISLAGALPCSSDPSASPSVENREPNKQTRVVAALGSPRKVTLTTDALKDDRRHVQGLPPGLVAPRRLPPSLLQTEDMQAQHQAWWPTQPWNPMFAPGFGFSGLPVDHVGHFEPRNSMPLYGADCWSQHIYAGAPHSSPTETLQRSLESFVREAMQNKMDSGRHKTTPSVSTTCSATTESDVAAPFCFEI
jgi:RNA recognition motif-containing protein